MNRSLQEIPPRVDPFIELDQCFLLAVRIMSPRCLARLRAMHARMLACGAAGDQSFTAHLGRVRTPGQLEHELEQWEAAQAPSCKIQVD